MCVYTHRDVFFILTESISGCAHAFIITDALLKDINPEQVQS